METILKKLNNDKGFALILAVTIVCLIVPITLQFSSSTVFYRISASNFKNNIQLRHASKSGFNFALALLYEDALTTEYDSKNEAWYEGFKTGADTSFGEVEFRIKIHDHSGKMNINLLVKQSNESKEESFSETQKEILIRLLKGLSVELEDEEIGDIVNSIKDWIDQDSDITDEGGIGEENESCRNGPLKSMDELTQIKGVDKAIFDELSDDLTIYGDGNININTADENILAALSDEMDAELIGDIEDYRTNDKNDLSNANWYKDVSGMSDITLENITVLSTHFEIVATGFKNDMKREIRSIIKREKQGDITILSRKID